MAVGLRDHMQLQMVSGAGQHRHHTGGRGRRGGSLMCWHLWMRGSTINLELQVVFSTEHPAGLKKAGCSAGIAITVSPQGASKTKRDFFTFFFGWFGCLFWGVFLHPPVLPLTAPQIPESRSTFRSAGHQPRLGCQGLAVWAHGWGCSLLHSPLQPGAELESQGCRLAPEGIVPSNCTLFKLKTQDTFVW